MLEWVQVIFSIGFKVYEAFQGGATTVRVDDVLPEKYRDRERLKELEAQAKLDYRVAP